MRSTIGNIVQPSGLAGEMTHGDDVRQLSGGLEVLFIALMSPEAALSDVMGRAGSCVLWAGGG
jgi:hypothetical protein